MAVAGYNVVPDENDEHVVGVELERANEYHMGKACIYMDQEEIHLDYYELCALIGQAKFVRLEMEWNMATYAHAREGSQGKSHLVRKGDAKLERSHFTIEPVACKFEKSLCGRPAPEWHYPPTPRGWDIDPVLGDPEHMNICKRCYEAWKKQPAVEK